MEPIFSTTNWNYLNWSQNYSAAARRVKQTITWYQMALIYIINPLPLSRFSPWFVPARFWYCLLFPSLEYAKVWFSIGAWLLPDVYGAGQGIRQADSQNNELAQAATLGMNTSKIKKLGASNVRTSGMNELVQAATLAMKMRCCFSVLL